MAAESNDFLHGSPTFSWKVETQADGQVKVSCTTHPEVCAVRRTTELAMAAALQTLQAQLQQRRL